MTGAPPPVGVDRAYVLLGRAHRLPGKFYRSLDGESLLARELGALGRAGLRVTLVSVRPVNGFDLEVLRDPRDAGPLGALCTVLGRAPPSFFLFGGDMPFVSERAVATMRRRYRGRTLVPLSADGHWQVLHAIYANVPIERAEQVLHRGRGLRDLVAELDLDGEVDWLAAGRLDERTFTDVDTPADLDALRAGEVPARPLGGDK